jgi:hypothetical protein
MRTDDDDIKAAFKRLPKVKAAAYDEMNTILAAQQARGVAEDVALLSRLMAAAISVVNGSSDQFALMQRVAIATNIFTSFVQELVQAEEAAQDEAAHATKQ